MDLDKRLVHTRGAGEGAISYDYLVLATGSENNYFGSAPLAAHTLSMKTLAEAQRLRNHIVACLEHAAQTTSGTEREPWLTFVIVGGGPTGVEFTGALLELLALVLGREYHELAPGSARVVLVEGTDRILPPFPASLSRYTQRVLERRGVEVLSDTLVEQATRRREALKRSADRIAYRRLVRRNPRDAPGGRLAARRDPLQAPAH